MINNKHIRIYLAGDSTVQTYEDNCKPQGGWGQFISDYFTKDLEFINHSIGGRSSKSFIKEGRLDRILNEMGKDDYLFIQMGHNDAATDKPERYTEPSVEYKKYLKEYINGARKVGAIPILITPIATLNFNGKYFVEEFTEYCNSMKQVAVDENIGFIDLMTESLKYLNSIEYDDAYSMFMISSNGTDHVHFTEKGADIIARIVSEEISKMNIPISKYAKKFS